MKMKMEKKEKLLNEKQFYMRSAAWCCIYLNILMYFCIHNKHIIILSFFSVYIWFIYIRWENYMSENRKTVWCFVMKMRKKKEKKLEKQYTNSKSVCFKSGDIWFYIFYTQALCVQCIHIHRYNRDEKRMLKAFIWYIRKSFKQQAGLLLLWN